MKLLISLFILSLLSTPSIQAFEKTAKGASILLRKIAAADEIVITDLNPASETWFGITQNGVVSQTKMSSPVRRITLTEKADIETIAKSLNFSDKPLKKIQIQDQDGNIVMIVPPCQCAGDFELSFLCKKQEVLRLKLYHEGAFIRITSDDATSEYDLIPPSGEHLIAIIRNIFRRSNDSQRSQCSFSASVH